MGEAAVTGPSQRDTVEAIRNQILALRQRRRQVEHEPPARALVLSAVDRWQAEAEAELDAMVDIRSLMRPADGRPAISTRIDMAKSGAALAAASLAERYRDAVEAEFARRRTDGIAPEVRTARLAEIDTEIRAAEKAEEIAIRQAEAVGFAILRRADADPRIVLASDADLF